MLKQNQLFKHAKGDCLRTCIANILEVPLLTVPDFMKFEGMAGPYEAWWLELQSWLKQRGYFFLQVALTDKTPWFPIPYDALCMLVGYTNSTVGKKERHYHIVNGKVAEDKFIILHDPLPEGSGLEDAGLEYVCFLVPLDPALIVTMRRMEPDEEVTIVDPRSGI